MAEFFQYRAIERRTRLADPVEDSRRLARCHCALGDLCHNPADLTREDGLCTSCAGNWGHVELHYKAIKEDQRHRFGILFAAMRPDV